MSTLEGRRCHECGKGTIRDTAKPGRRERYKTMMLELPTHVLVPTCDQCGTEWMDETTAENLDRALAIVYRERLHELLEGALVVLSEHIAIGRLEDLLGVTSGYLSRLRARAKDPSPQLAAELALLARDPAKRLAELEEVWLERAS